MTTHLHGGRIYEYADRESSDWSRIEDFSANINPLGPPESVLAELKASLTMVRHYPDHRHAAVKRVLANRFSLSPLELLCGNGATEVLELLLKELKPQRLVTMTPAFRGYGEAAGRLGIPTLEIPLFYNGQIQVPAAQLFALLKPGDCLVFNNPHNPTGSAWRWGEYKPLAQSLGDRQVTLVVDESFIDFLPDQNRWSAVSQVRGHTSLYVLRSATKMYGIPGLRFGFAVGNPEVLRRIESWRDGWSVNQLAQQAAAAAYQDHHFDERTWNWLQQAREWVQGTWGQHPDIHLYPTYVNFFLVRLPAVSYAQELLQKLMENHYYLRSMAGFAPLDGHYLRIAIRTPEANQKLWAQVLKVLR